MISPERSCQNLERKPFFFRPERASQVFKSYAKWEYSLKVTANKNNAKSELFVLPIYPFPLGMRCHRAIPELKRTSME